MTDYTDVAVKKPKGKIGKPRIFKKPKKLMKKVNEYLKHCEETGEPVLLIGFCNYVDIDKTTLLYYEKLDDSAYAHAVKKLRQHAEQNLVSGGLTGAYHATMSIFLAKNNHGYTDKTEMTTDNTHKIEVVRGTISGD